jgi:hypothetical protein
LGNYPPKSQHFKEINYEITKICFGGFGQISSYHFLKLPYLAKPMIGQHVIGFLDFLLLSLSCSHTWLHPLVTNLPLLEQHAATEKKKKH